MWLTNVWRVYLSSVFCLFNPLLYFLDPSLSSHRRVTGLFLFALRIVAPLSLLCSKTTFSGRKEQNGQRVMVGQAQKQKKVVLWFSWIPLIFFCCPKVSHIFSHFFLPTKKQASAAFSIDHQEQQEELGKKQPLPVTYRAASILSFACSQSSMFCVSML